MSMSKQRYLTKSRYMIGLECPTKLFYTKKNEYANQQVNDTFLNALAEGGFQVGELARRYYTGGHEIKSLEYDEALSQTNNLLKQDNVIIYEAAVAFENLFIRIDILIKNGNHLDLIEVKAKSYDLEKSTFLNKNGTIASNWKPYLYDVAFQKHVLRSTFPQYTVNAYLMMTNKSAVCQSDGLNQKFKIVRDGLNRTRVSVSDSLSIEDLDKKILIKVPVDNEVEMIFSGQDSKETLAKNFIETVKYLSDHYSRDERTFASIGSKCKTCEFTCSSEDEEKGLKSGFKECWKEALAWTDSDFHDPTVLDIWNYRKKDDLIGLKRAKIKDVIEQDIFTKKDEQLFLTPQQRQWLQVLKVQNNDNTPYFDKSGMITEFDSWNYPLHFIDFETSQVAIPFNKGRRPYEGIAFQFSHHVVDKNGKIEHVGEYINVEQGHFPNYDFLRALRTDLVNCNGTIFRYANHENSYLNLIYEQLINDESQIHDRDELCDFIKLISKSKNESVEKWEGSRSMVDMCELVKKYYYDPAMGGSNSIKQVLPAILNSSKYLQDKYSKPIYGSKEGISSKNFKDWTWIQTDKNKIIDPYKLLPTLFENMPDEKLDLLTQDNDLNSGGAAMTAYARIQFSEISDFEKKELCSALLKYCELDTLAMVMIYEGWREML